MSSVQKKTPKKEKSSVPKQPKSKHKKDRKHHSKDGKRGKEAQGNGKEPKEPKDPKKSKDPAPQPKPAVKSTPQLAKKEKKQEKEQRMIKNFQELIDSEEKEEAAQKEKEKTLELEATQLSDPSVKKPRTPRIEPLPPGAKQNTPSNTPDKRVQQLYKILDEISDTKSSAEKTMTPDVKTPKKDPLDKSRSLKATQSFKSFKSPPKPVSIAPGPKVTEKKQKSQKGELPMKTPPKSDKDMRSDLDAPVLEEGFRANHGDTRQTVDMQKVDIDLIGRTGMYMERGGMALEKKQAFDWIAYNRHDLKHKQISFSQSLAVALGDVGIGKQLAMRTLVYLKSQHQITQQELDKVFQELQTCPPTITFSQLSSFMQKHCQTYMPIQIEPIGSEREKKAMELVEQEKKKSNALPVTK